MEAWWGGRPAGRRITAPLPHGKSHEVKMQTWSLMSCHVMIIHVVKIQNMVPSRPSPTYTSNPRQWRIVESSKAWQSKPSLSPNHAFFSYVNPGELLFPKLQLFIQAGLSPHLVRHTDPWVQVWIHEPGLVSHRVPFPWTQKGSRHGLWTPSPNMSREMHCD